jgi:glyoxylase-like metal-dependent hydrolase (beta-lactamase superfamily II)
VLRADAALVDGVTVATDVGEWRVVETPGHAPSHVCLHQPERRLLLSGDHLLGRISLFFDVGSTPDPVAEFVRSLDRVEGLDVRLCLPGHGRPFTDAAGHIAGNRDLVAAQLDAVRALLAEGPATAWDIAGRLHGELFGAVTASWLLQITLAWLTHLERRGEASRGEGADAEVWAAAP